MLVGIVEKMRHEIEEMGGKFCFRSKVTDLIFENNTLKEIEINNDKRIPAQVCVLAPGHSARDTFKVLSDRDLEMNPKAFAIGKIIVIWVGLLLAIFAYKKWYSEALFLGSNLVLTGLLVLLLKNIYQRPRPSILHLVEEKGFSFPSGHSLASTLVLGSLIIIIGQHVKNKTALYCLQGFLVLGIVTIVVSRIYVGVHYPSDVLGSMILGLAVLQFEYPLYDRLRFQWRFTGKQK